METTIVYWGYIGTMENKMQTTIVYWGYIGIIEKKMETTIAYWGYIGIVEKEMEATIVYWNYIGFSVMQSFSIQGQTLPTQLLRGARSCEGALNPKP